MPLTYKLLAGLAIAVALWFSGDYHGQGVVHAKWDKQKVVDAAAADKELDRQRSERQAYDSQIQGANDARDSALISLARLADTPHPRLVCHAAPASSGEVPQIPAAAGPSATGVGQLSNQPELDISETLYEEARRADAIVEGCRDLYNRWPQQEAP